MWLWIVQHVQWTWNKMGYNTVNINMFHSYNWSDLYWATFIKHSLKMVHVQYSTCSLLHMCPYIHNWNTHQKIQIKSTFSLCSLSIVLTVLKFGRYWQLLMCLRRENLCLRYVQCSHSCWTESDDLLKSGTYDQQRSSWVPTPNSTWRMHAEMIACHHFP